MAASEEPSSAGGPRLLRTLMAFTTDEPRRTVAQLSADVGAPVSTIYRYLSVLREAGLVDAVGDGSYRLTDATASLAAAARAAREDVAGVAAEELRELRDRIDETVLIARRSGVFAYCIAREESSHPVRLQFAIGQAMPLHSGSVARLLLAWMPDRERAGYLDSLPPEVGAARRELLTPVALEEVRQQGWTESYEEVDAEVWGIAAAITFGAHGPVVAALGTAGPLHRLDAERRDVVIADVRATAQRISIALAR